jgi:hypothetical protein
MRWKTLVPIILVVIVSGGAVAYTLYLAWWSANYYVEEHTDYHVPADQVAQLLADDRLADKNPAFDADLVDSRPLGDWQVNASAAVIKLDCPLMKPDHDAELLVLRPSYAAALEVAKKQGFDVLPSANMLDGSAKQFDDGLYAALDLAAFRGELAGLPGAVDFVQAVFAKLPADSPARPFLAVALELAGRKVDLSADERTAADAQRAEFERDQARSKPIGFYTWSDELQQVWRFCRFLQFEFDARHQGVPRALAGVLEGAPDLRKEYATLSGFFARLTNPRVCLSLEPLIGGDDDLASLARRAGVRHEAVAVLPPSTSRETELFERLFGNGLPPGANLMVELIQAVRSGKVDLTPGKEDGWYQYQAHALETFLLPSRGQEEPKLLLTASYKKRLVEAFQALITKRRETHARQLDAAKAKSEALLPGEVRPRLRVEPCATFYLRTARAYAFLQNLLLATVGQEHLAKLHGLREAGQREPNLAVELEGMRQRFYGLYLVACEDIGLKPQFLSEEPVDRAAAKEAALGWLAKLESDRDLACDTRVSVPILRDLPRNKTRLWTTLGVRLARLDASYARPPNVRPKDGSADWKAPERYQVGESHYVIAVDEFAEIELSGSASLTRAELRAACDQHQTKAAIVEAVTP